MGASRVLEQLTGGVALHQAPSAEHLSVDGQEQLSAGLAERRSGRVLSENPSIGETQAPSIIYRRVPW